MKLSHLAAAGLLMSAVGVTAVRPASGESADRGAASVVDGKAAFAPCSACHSAVAGKNGPGPSLHRIVGRKPASLSGFAYSAAMKAKGGVWNAAALDAFLGAPGQIVPGTRMFYAGQKDAAKRAAIIAYLKTLR